MENNNSGNPENKKMEKYKILINARNFHYENFHKWMSYFYIAVGALFVAYYTISINSVKAESTNSIISAHNPKQEFLELTITMLGYIVCLLWYWSSKGYYYWNINFIALVNNYEKEILQWEEKDRIYFVFANKKTQNDYLSPISGANVSTSKVAIFFAFTITVFWGFLFLANAIPKQCNCSKLIYILSFILSIFTTIVLSVLLPKGFLFSKIDHFPDLKIDQSLS